MYCTYSNRQWSVLTHNQLIELIKLLTLYWRFLSVIVWPSRICVEVEQGFEPLGHRHCFSTHGLPYVSNLLHTLFGLQTGNEASEFCKKKIKSWRKTRIDISLVFLSKNWSKNDLQLWAKWLSKLIRKETSSPGLYILTKVCIT